MISCASGVWRSKAANVLARAAGPARSGMAIVTSGSIKSLLNSLALYSPFAVEDKPRLLSKETLHHRRLSRELKRISVPPSYSECNVSSDSVQILISHRQRV